MKKYSYKSGRVYVLFAVGLASALFGADLAHRFWKPDLVG